jgi:hypothetical protein
MLATATLRTLMSRNSLREELADLLQRIKDEARGIYPGEIVEIKTADGYVLSLYWRTIRLFDGVVLLLKNRLPEEALIIARSLFVDALRLAEIGDAGEKRGALILGWANNSIENKKNLLKEATRLGLESDPTALFAELESQQKKLQSHRSRNGIGPLRSFLSERAASEKFGRSHDYWSYAFSHEFVHGSDFALTYSRKKRADGVLAVYDQTNDPQLSLGVACFSAKSVLQAAAATALTFNWSGIKAIEILETEVVNLEEKHKSVG